MSIEFLFFMATILIVIFNIEKVFTSPSAYGITPCANSNERTEHKMNINDRELKEIAKKFSNNHLSMNIFTHKPDDALRMEINREIQFYYSTSKSNNKAMTLKQITLGITTTTPQIIPTKSSNILLKDALNGDSHVFTPNTLSHPTVRPFRHSFILSSTSGTPPPITSLIDFSAITPTIMLSTCSTSPPITVLTTTNNALLSRLVSILNSSTPSTLLSTSNKLTPSALLLTSNKTRVSKLFSTFVNTTPSSLLLTTPNSTSPTTSLPIDTLLNEKTTINKMLSSTKTTPLFNLLPLTNDIIYNYTGVCPITNKISPCTCDNYNIKCHTNGSALDLEHIFSVISKVNDGEQRHFDTFELNNSVINEFPDNLFKRITFNTIKLIDCKRLTCISRKAFIGLEKSLEKFFAFNTSFGSFNSDCSLFNILKQLENLQEISIIGSKIREIPERAFAYSNDRQMQLKSIDFSGGPSGGYITKVGQKSFESLKALKYLNLSSNKINTIESNAFAFKSSSNDSLVIDLENNLLNEQSFDKNSFKVNGRQTLLKLSNNSGIRMLKEVVFHQFLVEQNNTIDIANMHMKCIYQNVWILENKIKLEKQLRHLSPQFWKQTAKQCDD